MVALIDKSRTDVHVVKGSGSVSKDTARIAAAVAKIVAKGFGTIVFDGSSAPGGIVYNSSQHRFQMAKANMTATPGTRVISTTQSSSFWWGAHYDPWDATEGYVGSTLSSVTANATQLTGMPEFILKITATGGQYRLTINGSTTGDIVYNANAATILAAINAVGALTDKVTVAGTFPQYTFNVSGMQADTMTVASGTSPMTGGTATVTPLGEGDWVLLHAENTPSGITPHGTEPQRPMEFHRLSRQVLQNQARTFTLTITATGGQYRITINGSQTADIAYNAASGTIQTAINAVGALNGKVTVSGTGPFTFTMAGTFANQQNTMTVASGTSPLTGGTATVATTTSVVNKINSFYIDAPTFDAYSTNQGFLKVPVVQGIHVYDVQFESAAGNGPASSCLFFVGCVDLKVTRCRFGSDNGRMNPGGIYRNFCTGTMEDCQICDHEDPNVTMPLIKYGSVDSVCNGFRHSRCKFGAVRHGFTNGGVARTVSSISYRYGTAIDGIIEDCTFGTPNGQNASTAGVTGYPYLDFHSEAARYVVKGCKFLLTEWQVALQIRSRAITVEGCFFEGMGLSELGYIAAQDFVFKNNRVENSYNLRFLSLGFNNNVDRARIVDNTFINCVSAAIRFSTGTGHEVTGNTFHNVNTVANGVGSPWTPKCCIHVQGLTDSSSTLRVANNVAPKSTNCDFFVYASGINANQLEYVGNVVPGYGRANIGLPRLRVSAAGVADPTGAVGTAIAATPEWEQKYGWQNGQQKWKYCKKTGHGLTTSDVNKTIDKGGSIYDDTDGSKVPDGILADIVNDDYYVLYPHGSTFEMPVGMLGGTYSMGSDPRDIYWDATASGGGKYMNNKPGDSATSAPPMLRVNHVDATNMWVTLLGQSSAGSVPYAATLTLAADDANCTVGDGKISFQLPYDLDNISVTGMCSSAPTGSGMTGRLRANGTIFTSPVVTIEVNETKSSDAVTQPGTTVSTLAAGTIISADQITIGSTLPGKGFKITLLGTIVG